MTWESYLTDSNRTLIDLGKDDNIIHAAIGIATEIGELKEAFDDINRKEELGDIYWYMAILWREFELDWKSPYIEKSEETIEFLAYTECLNSLDFLSKQLLDQAKRVKFYKMSLNKFNTDIIHHISVRLTHILVKSDFNFESILEVNINKLKARFPLKFNSSDALNRDLNKEREILERG